MHQLISLLQLGQVQQSATGTYAMDEGSDVAFQLEIPEHWLAHKDELIIQQQADIHGADSMEQQERVDVPGNDLVVGHKQRHIVDRAATLDEKVSVIIEYVMHEERSSKEFTQDTEMHAVDETVTSNELGNEVGVIIQCQGCEEQLHSECDLLQHMEAHVNSQPLALHDGIVIQCDVCQLQLCSEDNLLEHMQRHSSEKSSTLDGKSAAVFIQCEVCKEQLTSKDNLVHHMQIHNNSDDQVAAATVSDENPVVIIQCEMCEKELTSNDNLVQHMQIHIADKPAIVDEKSEVIIRWEVCESESNSEEIIVQQIHVDEDGNAVAEEKPIAMGEVDDEEQSSKIEKFDSRIIQACDNGGSRNNNVQNVIQFIYKPHKCVDCSAEFDSITELRSHKQKTHTGDKPFKCSICKQQLSTKGNLTQHMQIHSGNKPFRCHLCTKQFTRNNDLLNHTRTHAGEKNYKCLACGKQFSQSSSLITHMRSHTGEKPFKCLVCSKQFNRNDSLTRHIRTHTGERPYVCNTCQGCFSDRSSLRRHAKMQCMSLLTALVTSAEQSLINQQPLSNGLPYFLHEQCEVGEPPCEVGEPPSEKQSSSTGEQPLVKGDPLLMGDPPSEEEPPTERKLLIEEVSPTNGMNL